MSVGPRGEEVLDPDSKVSLMCAVSHALHSGFWACLMLCYCCLGITEEQVEPWFYFAPGPTNHIASSALSPLPFVDRQLLHIVYFP